MERFRFGEQEGHNGKKTTFNGWLAVFGTHLKADTHIEADQCCLEVAGPNGGVRSLVVMDKATAVKLGAALLKWAGTGGSLLSDSFLREMGYVVRNLDELPNEEAQA